MLSDAGQRIKLAFPFLQCVSVLKCAYSFIQKFYPWKFIKEITVQGAHTQGHIPSTHRLFVAALFITVKNWRRNLMSIESRLIK